ncbi:unnamed protein product [Rotaria sp. Silwood1]|nr:unnamed protein product [Rotaria sp. Silwood1]
MYQPFLSQLRSDGGDDEPEDVLGALNQVMLLNWEAKVKFAILVCDAPAHGRECNDSINDRFPNGLNFTVEEIMKKLTEKNIDLILCHLKATTTKKMADTFLTHLRKLQSNRNDQELLRQIELYNKSVVEQIKPYHFIFVLDESGSMSGQPWAALTEAYNTCLKERIKIAQHSTNDIVSVIQFDSEVRCICQESALSSGTPSLQPLRGRGTNFSPALKEALRVLNTSADSYIPVLLFMSDGAGSGGPAEMTTIYNQYHHRGLQVHSIAFGSSVDKATLKKIATVGGGQFHHNSTGKQLVETFVQISTELTAVDGLIDEFAQRVSDAATTKLAFEFL